MKHLNLVVINAKNTMIDPFDCCYPLLLEDCVLEDCKHGPLLVVIRFLPVSGQMYPQIMERVAVQVVGVLDIQGDRPRHINIQHALKYLIEPQQLRDAILAMQWALRNDPDADEEDAFVVGCTIDLINFSSAW